MDNTKEATPDDADAHDQPCKHGKVGINAVLKMIGDNVPLDEILKTAENGAGVLKSRLRAGRVVRLHRARLSLLNFQARLVASRHVSEALAQLTDFSEGRQSRHAAALAVLELAGVRRRPETGKKSHKRSGLREIQRAQKMFEELSNEPAWEPGSPGDLSEPDAGTTAQPKA